MSDNARRRTQPGETCMWCNCPLEPGHPGHSCDSCYEWNRRCSMNPARLTLDQLYELEAYSRKIYTRPPSPEELEFEQTSRAADALRRKKHADQALPVG